MPIIGTCGMLFMGLNYKEQLNLFDLFSGSGGVLVYATDSKPEHLYELTRNFSCFMFHIITRSSVLILSAKT
jgi:hypothetical protein